ncbi:heat shock 70 kDa protein-like [Zophobas morio]|uniref:heat shock 70 kDa protein-like n=1 Tax=Zophobas morio TaxID=2755281 RepID=UPI003082BA0D
MADIAIGIDFGTTNSCVCVYRKSALEVLENSDGGRLTPSYVFFLQKPGAPIVGQCAKKMSDMLPSNGIYEIKRFVGKSFNSLKKNLPYYSFDVKNDSGTPVILIERENGTVKLTPQEVCALIFTKLKKDVETKLGHAVSKAVITVPAYFKSIEREVILAAANQAGFTVLKLFNEPTAAALSFYYKKDIRSESYSLVYDLGGGTFDVSVLKKHSNNIDIIGVDGDTNLGGKDFDNLIIEELAKTYRYYPKKERREIRRLQNKCEEAKIELSTAEQTIIILDGFVPNQRVVTIELSRQQFESRAQNLFERTIKIVDRCLKSSKVPINKINNVILSGGSSRIPKIQEMLSNYFNGKSLTKFVNLDECVAEGAALQAAMLANSSKQKIRKMKMTDVVPLSLGVMDYVNRMHFIVRKDTPIPAENTLQFRTTEDQQTSLRFDVYEGERVEATKNRYLGFLTLNNITPAPPRLCRVLVTVIVDQNGILKIKASEVLRNNSKELNLSYTRGWRSEDEIVSTLVDAEEHEAQDDSFENFAALKEYLLSYCEAVQYNLRFLKLIRKHKAIHDLCENTKNVAVSLGIDKIHEVQSMLAEVQYECEKFAQCYNFECMPPC